MIWIVLIMAFAAIICLNAMRSLRAHANLKGLQNDPRRQKLIRVLKYVAWATLGLSIILFCIVYALN